ncbi:MAG: ComEC/Rec2 family competence protein [Eubacteriales bacterium]
MKIRSAIQKVLIFLTALFLLSAMLILTSCQTKENVDDDSVNNDVSDGNTTDADAEGFAVAADGSAARIVYPSDDGENGYALADSLATAIKNICGIKPTVKSDYLRDGEERNSDEAEILIGLTGYDESIQVYAELTDYSQCLIRMAGNKLVIASYDSSALNDAVIRLKLEFSHVKQGNDIILAEDYSVSFSSDKTLSEAKLPILADAKPQIIDEGDSCLEFVFSKLSEDTFLTYLNTLSSGGYSLYTENSIEENIFKTYTNSTSVVNIGFIPKMSRMYLTVEPLAMTALPLLESDNSYTAVTTTLFSQIGLYSGGTNTEKDTADVNGMCYVMRLEDGSFIIIDGGHGESDDAERIFNTMRKQAPDPDNMVIAAWIFTHAHGDHVGTFPLFAKTYGDVVPVEQFIFNFPSSDAASQGGGDSRSQVMSAINSTAYKTSKRVKAHVGQVFYIRNVKIEILCNLELLEPYTMQSNDNSYNNTSLIFTMETNGKRIMILGDCYPAESAAMKRIYTSQTLKCDIVQIAHHGIEGTKADLYSLIAPEYAFWPAGSYNYAGYHDPATGIIRPKFAAMGITSIDMRLSPWNEYFSNPDNISPENIYLAADDIHVAEIKDEGITVTCYDTAEEYFKGQP